LLSYSKKSEPTSKLIIVTTMLAKKAVQKPDTLNPGTSVDTRSIISALMTSKNRPKVMSVSGIVNMITTGLITALARPSRMADKIKDFLLVNEIP